MHTFCCLKIQWIFLIQEKDVYLILSKDQMGLSHRGQRCLPYVVQTFWVGFLFWPFKRGIENKFIKGSMKMNQSSSSLGMLGWKACATARRGLSLGRNVVLFGADLLWKTHNVLIVFFRGQVFSLRAQTWSVPKSKHVTFGEGPGYFGALGEPGVWHGRACGPSPFPLGKYVKLLYQHLLYVGATLQRISNLLGWV